MVVTHRYVAARQQALDLLQAPATAHHVRDRGNAHAIEVAHAPAELVIEVLLGGLADGRCTMPFASPSFSIPVASPVAGSTTTSFGSGMSAPRSIPAAAAPRCYTTRCARRTP